MTKFDRGEFFLAPNKSALRGLPPVTQTVYFWLTTYMDENGLCFPSRKRLRADAGIKSLTTVDKAIKELTDRGIINKAVRKKDNNENTTNLYQINTVPGPKNVLGGPKNEAQGSTVNGQELNLNILTQSTEQHVAPSAPGARASFSSQKQERLEALKQTQKENLVFLDEYEQLPTKPRPKKKPRPKPKPAVQTMLAVDRIGRYFLDKTEEKYGTRIRFDFSEAGANYKLTKKAVKEFGEETVKDMIDWYLWGEKCQRLGLNYKTIFSEHQINSFQTREAQPQFQGPIKV